jgi:hypothetical protein
MEKAKNKHSPRVLPSDESGVLQSVVEDSTPMSTHRSLATPSNGYDNGNGNGIGIGLEEKKASNPESESPPLSPSQEVEGPTPPLFQRQDSFLKLKNPSSPPPEVAQLGAGVVQGNSLAPIALTSQGVVKAKAVYSQQPLSGNGSAVAAQPMAPASDASVSASADTFHHNASMEPHVGDDALLEVEEEEDSSPGMLEDDHILNAPGLMQPKRAKSPTALKRRGLSFARQGSFRGAAKRSRNLSSVDRVRAAPMQRDVSDVSDMLGMLVSELKHMRSEMKELQSQQASVSARQDQILTLLSPVLHQHNEQDLPQQ